MSFFTPNEPIPDALEIKDQLLRILGSPRFRSASNPSDFLRLVVERNLAGKITTEDIVGKTLFGAKYVPDESSDVRVTAINLRKTIKKYYEAEGIDDPVIITLPEPSKDRSIKMRRGEAYTPLYCYNIHHEISRQYRLGLHFLQMKNTYDGDGSLGAFMEVLALSPNHADAHVGLVEALLIQTFLDGIPWDYTALAEEFVKKLIDDHPKYYKSWLMHGSLRLLQRDFAAAEKLFAHALILDEVNASSSRWYHLFLVLDGQVEKAIARSRLLVKSFPEDAIVQTLHAAWLYLDRRYLEAEVALKVALRLDGHWFTFIMQALVQRETAQSPLDLRSLHSAQLATRNRPQDYLFPGLHSLIAAQSKNDNATEVAMHAMNILKNPEFDRATFFQCALFMVSSPFRYWHPAESSLQLFQSLEYSADQLEPYFLFIHLCPIFDLFRTDARFEALLAARRKPPVEREPRPLSLEKFMDLGALRKHIEAHNYQHQRFDYDTPSDEAEV